MITFKAVVRRNLLFIERTGFSLTKVKRRLDPLSHIDLWNKSVIISKDFKPGF
jgi:hypothetical protein